MKISKLEIPGAKLEFCIDDSGWCQVKLVTGEDILILGADSWEILKTKFQHALATLSESSEPEWILSLAEEHCILYRQNVDGKNYFFWQNAQGEKIWESELLDPINEKLQ